MKYLIKGLKKTEDGFSFHVVSEKANFWISISDDCMSYFIYNAIGERDDIAKIVKQITTDNNLV